MNNGSDRIGAMVFLLLASSGACSGSTTHGTPPAGTEGEACDSSHPCKTALHCVASPFTLNVCGRGCKSATDCKTGEQCFNYSGDSSDNLCVNVVDDEYAKCGVSETSICGKDRTCLYLPNEAYGLCVSTCALDGSIAGASGDDAGTESDVDAGTSGGTVPKGAVACMQSQMCVDKVLADPTANEGVCGAVVERGQACGIEQGIYCRTSVDICAPKDPNDFSSATLCFQDCSDTGTCDSGKCVNVQNLFSYCM